MTTTVADRTRRTVLCAAVAVSVIAAGCGSAGDSSSATSSTAAGATGTSQVSVPLPAPPDTTASSYPTIAALAQALNDNGITCQLSYPGLKDDVTAAELSICTIDGEQAYLRVWPDRSFLTEFLASPDGRSGVAAVGANWMITFVTPATAARVAAAIGGSAPGAG